MDGTVSVSKKTVSDNAKLDAIVKNLLRGTEGGWRIRALHGRVRMFR